MKDDKVFDRVASVCIAIDMAIQALKEQKVGRWIWDGCMKKCSVCGTSGENQLYDSYCGKCGAKMEGAEE